MSNLFLSLMEMIVVGLTGGIGSGKSTIARIFKILGVQVYSSDERAKEMYFLPEIRAKIESLLGKEAYLNPTTLNKKFIADCIFSNDTLLQQVNALIHEAVKEDFKTFLQKHQKEKYLIKESALLIEAHLLASVDKVLVVTSKAEIRIQRVILRDGLNETDIQKRIHQQLPDEEKIKKADWVIENNEEKLLIPQVLQIHQKLLQA